MTMTDHRPRWMLHPSVCPHNEIAYSDTATWCETCWEVLHDDDGGPLGERFEECEQSTREAFRAWHSSGMATLDPEGLPDLAAFRSVYAGTWFSFREYAEEVARATVLADVAHDEPLSVYFNLDAWTRDLLRDCWTAPEEHGGVHVFRRAGRGA